MLQIKSIFSTYLFSILFIYFFSDREMKLQPSIRVVDFILPFKTGNDILRIDKVIPLTGELFRRRQMDTDLSKQMEV